MDGRAGVLLTCHPFLASLLSVGVKIQGLSKGWLQQSPPGPDPTTADPENI